MERITEKGIKSYLDLYDRLCDIEDMATCKATERSRILTTTM